MQRFEILLVSRVGENRTHGLNGGPCRNSLPGRRKVGSTNGR